MATAGFNTTIKVGGTPVSMTNEACTKLTANTRYQITDATKRILDPATVAPLIEVDPLGDGNWEEAEDHTIDADLMLFGIVTFTVDQGVNALVRVTAYYIPTHSIVEAKAIEINEKNELADDTVYGDTARSAMPTGFKDFDGNIDQLDPGTEDLDAGGGVLKLKTLLANRTKFLLEVRPGGSGHSFRGWAIFSGRKAVPELADLVKFGFPFKGAPKDFDVADDDGKAAANFTWA